MIPRDTVPVLSLYLTIAGKMDADLNKSYIPDLRNLISQADAGFYIKTGIWKEC